MVERGQRGMKNNLKATRVALGMTQKEVAYGMYIDQCTYSGYETGKHVPSLEVAIKIATYYKTPVETLWCVDA